MRYSLIAAAISAAILSASGMAVAQHQEHHGHKGHGAATADMRVLVNMPPQLVDHTLANMRDHLLALQKINEALAQGKNDQAAATAEQKLGMTSLRLHGAHEVAKYMPEGMQQAGTAMHRQPVWNGRPQLRCDRRSQSQFSRCSATLLTLA